MAYIICWSCNGTGIIPLINPRGAWGTELCPDCRGTGCDKKKTKETKAILESEKNYPLPLVLKREDN